MATDREQRQRRRSRSSRDEEGEAIEVATSCKRVASLIVRRRRDEHGRSTGPAVHGGAERGRDAPGQHPRRHLRVPRHRHLRLRRRGLRPLPREDVPRHEHGGRSGGGGAGARAGPVGGRRRGRQHLGRAREPGHHLRRADRRPRLPRPRRLLLGGAAAGRRRGVAAAAPGHGRGAPAGVRAGDGGRRLARRAPRGRHDVRTHVRLLRHGDRPEAGQRRDHRPARRGVPARRQRAGGWSVRRRRDEPGEGVRPGACRVEVEAPLGVLAGTFPRRRDRRDRVRVPRHPGRRRRRRGARAPAPPAARAGGLLALAGRAAASVTASPFLVRSGLVVFVVSLCMSREDSACVCIIFCVVSSCEVVNKGPLRYVPC